MTATSAALSASDGLPTEHGNSHQVGHSISLGKRAVFGPIAAPLLL